MVRKASGLLSSASSKSSLFLRRGVTVDARLEHVRWLEHHDAPRQNRHFDAGLRVAPMRLTLRAHDERAERRELYGFAARRRFGDLVEKGLHDLPIPSATIQPVDKRPPPDPRASPCAETSNLPSLRTCNPPKPPLAKNPIAINIIAISRAIDIRANCATPAPNAARVHKRCAAANPLKKRMDFRVEPCYAASSGTRRRSSSSKVDER